MSKEQNLYVLLKWNSGFYGMWFTLDIKLWI